MTVHLHIQFNYNCHLYIQLTFFGTEDKKHLKKMGTAVQDFWKTIGLEKTVLLFWPSQAKSLLLDIGFSCTASYFIDAFMLFLLLVTLAEYVASESLSNLGNVA